MSYATKVTGEAFQGCGGEYRPIRNEVILNNLITVLQLTQSESTDYDGLDEATAKKLASPYDAVTNPDGLIKTNLGGIKITVTDGVATSWFSVFSCRGTIETATCQRKGISTLFTVHYNKTTLSCTADGGTVTNI